MNTINPNVSKFISTFAEKLWNRMITGQGYNEPLRLALQNTNGFIAAFAMMFDREPSKVEIEFYTLHLYEHEHVYLTAYGSDAVGFCYHSNKPNGYLVKMRAKFNNVSVNVPAWGNKPIWTLSSPTCWRAPANHEPVARPTTTV